MQRRDWRVRVEDMKLSIERIQSYTEGIEFAAFAADQKTIDAVIRNFEIIGEAAVHIPGELEEQYAHLPIGDIRGMRNLLAHKYWDTDLEVVWDTVHNHLESLRNTLILVLLDDPAYDV